MGESTLEDIALAEYVEECADMLIQVRRNSKAGPQPVFDPHTVLEQMKPVHKADHALSKEELIMYGELATRIREEFA